MNFYAFLTTLLGYNSIANRGYREEISHVEINQNIILPKKYMYKDGEESYQAIFNTNKVEIIKK